MYLEQTTLSYIHLTSELKKNFPQNVIIFENGNNILPLIFHFYLWGHSLRDNQLCLAFITPSILVLFLIPFVEMFVLAIGRDVKKEFLQLSKLTEL